ncbi:MBL fold metallo-hydrolase (plasmid) [Deinococcus radiomollis]|uniref:MBL fold metallo-hydrolase n=1 Tax=Deinococcus radiomollis TaxID=468916 RepID=UPI00389184BA
MTLDPVQLSPHVYALPIHANLGSPTTIFPALILDEAHGATLIDTGIPGMENDLLAALQSLGLGWSDVKRIIITHHDLDHIGSLPAIVAASGAEVLTSAGELPYVQGEQPPQKAPPRETWPSLPPQRQAMLNNPPNTPVTQVLEDGEVLPIAGGVKIVFTPGHTAGHLSVYVQQEGVLITGDALVSEEGQLQGPAVPHTADMEEAMRSAQKLAQLPALTVLTYHGGAVTQDTALQLTRVAGNT